MFSKWRLRHSRTKATVARSADDTRVPARKARASVVVDAERFAKVLDAIPSGRDADRDR